MVRPNHHMPFSDKISFDILRYISSCYAVNETILHPLETLLLVSKSWSHAALGHRRLWNDFRIYLGHEPTCTIWAARLPLRLARCGPDIPLDIDLRNLLNVDTDEGRDDLDVNQLSFEVTCDTRNLGMYDIYDVNIDNCTCFTTAYSSVRLLLQALAGSNGQKCARWRSLVLYLGPEGNSESRWIQDTLSHATPIFESLELGHIKFAMGYSSRYCLPDVTRLKRLALFECRLPFLPNCDNLVDVKLSWEEDQGVSSNLSAFDRASKLQVLSLGSTFDVRLPLPAQLNDLRVLKIEGMAFRFDFDKYVCHMPRLSHLFIDLSGGNVISRVLCFKWVPIEKLARITITWHYRHGQSEESCVGMMNAIRRLLGRSWNLKWLAADRAILCFTIKVLWNSLSDPVNESIAGPDALPAPVFKNVSLVNIFDEDTVEFDGSETKSFLEDLATKWQFLPPDLPDDEFAQRMVNIY
jgi:hypothetical protein